MSMSPLQQPVHILRKDATHLWPEVLVSIALLAAYAWSETQTWLPPDGTFNPVILAVVFLRFLIPIAWLVLISRLVHDEELVGDRQFWITRPYTWYSLLLSKVLFVAVFICGPFLIMQAWLLHHAGLYPTLLVPAMLKNLLYIAAVFLLPLFAIAAVTSTFVRYISSALAGLIYFFIVFAFAAYLWPDNLSAPYLVYALNLTILALLIAATLLQYWRRKTLIARILVAVVPLVVLVFVALVPSNALNSHRYPNTSTGALVFDPNPMLQQPDGRLFTFRKKVITNLPVDVQLTGLSDRSELEVQRYRVTIDGPNNVHYTSGWSPDRASFSANRKTYVVPVSLPQEVFDRIHNDAVAVHLQLGTQTLNPGTPYTVTALETPFPLPGHAACTVTSDDGNLECRFAFRNPTFQSVEATVHSGNCLTPGPQTAPAFAGLAPSLTPFSFSPVEILRAQLSVGEAKASLCAGTPATFTPMTEGPYGRLTLDIPAIKLDSYALRIPTKQPTPRPEPQP